VEVVRPVAMTEPLRVTRYRPRRRLSVEVVQEQADLRGSTVGRPGARGALEAWCPLGWWHQPDCWRGEREGGTFPAPSAACDCVSCGGSGDQSAVDYTTSSAGHRRNLGTVAGIRPCTGLRRHCQTRLARTRRSRGAGRVRGQVIRGGVGGLVSVGSAVDVGRSPRGIPGEVPRGP